MPQTAYMALRIDTVDLPSGPYTITPDPIVSAATKYQHLSVTVSALTTVTVVAPAGATFLWVGFPLGNTLPLAFSTVGTDTGLSIGPTGWAALAVPLSQTAQNYTLKNPSGTGPVTVEVILV